MNVVNSYHLDSHTETAGTVITDLIPPLIKSTTDRDVHLGVRTRLTSLSYTPGSTAHSVVVMRALKETTTTAAEAATDTAVTLTTDSFVGQTIASGDYLVIQHSDGTCGLYLASANSSATITINALSKAVNASAKVWIMGHPTNEAAYHQTYTTVASTRNDFLDILAGVCCSGFDTGTYSMSGRGEPLVLYSGNASNAGTLNYANAVYVRE